MFDQSVVIALVRTALHMENMPGASGANGTKH